MRKVLGGVVFLAGLGGLGIYASQGPARTIEAQIAQAAAEAAGLARHGVTAQVSGRDITLSGTFHDTTEQQALLAALGQIPGQRAIGLAATEVLPVASPYALRFEMGAEGITVTGNTPSQADAAALGLDGLTLASGEPEGWTDAVRGLLDAVAFLNTAHVVVSDTNIVITGMATSPSEERAFTEALAGVPGNYMILPQIELADDGTPLRLSLRYDGAALQGDGKIPADLDISGVAGAENLALEHSPLAAQDRGWPVAAQRALAALTALQSGELEIDGATGRLSGTGAPADLDAAQAALADLPAGFEIAMDLALFDDGAPFKLIVEKTEGGMQAAGKVPADFDAGAGLGNVRTAFITDDSGVWPEIGTAGLDALALLDTGTLTITEDGVALSGAAASFAVEQQVIGALAAYDPALDISVADDGVPVVLQVTFTPVTGVVASGKLPQAMQTSDISAALGFTVTDAGLVESTVETDVDLIAPLAALRDTLPDVARLTFMADPERTTVNLRTWPGVDAPQLASILAAKLGDGVALDVRPVARLPAEGATRVNLFSGRDEVFRAGHWLAQFDIVPSPVACATAAEDILSTTPVQFIGESAALNVKSSRAINALSGLARTCATQGGVFLQVDGPAAEAATPEALRLRIARANSVRDALLTRGLARAVVTAVQRDDLDQIATTAISADAQAARGTAFIWNFE